MRENYYALLVAIFRNVTPQDAINYFKYGHRSKHFDKNINIDRLDIVSTKTKNYYSKNPKVIERRNTKLREKEEEYRMIVELKKNHTWREIGEILGIGWSTAYARKKNFEKNKANC